MHFSKLSSVSFISCHCGECCGYFFLSFCGTASETFLLLTVRWQMVLEGRQTVLRRAKWKETETKKGMEKEKRRAGDGDMGKKKIERISQDKLE